MDKKVYIRMATAEDAPKIKKITKEAFKLYAESAGIAAANAALSETIDDIKQDIQTKYVFVCVADDKLAGSLRIEISPDKTAYLSRFGVLCEYQSLGCGKEMMKYADKFLMKKGVEKLYLHTASKVLKAMRFYYSCGFYAESVSSEKGYLRALMCKDYI